MNSFWMKSAVLLASCGSLVGCGSGSTREEPVNTDYSALRLAPSHEGALSYATSDEQLLRAVRNGLRMSQTGLPQLYQLQSQHGSAEFLAAISQDYRGWLGGPALDFMALQPDRTRMTYSGSHLFEISGLNGGTPQLEFKGVIETAESDGSNPFPTPPHTVPRRAVMHDDAVFVIDGERFLGSLWSGVAF